MNMIFIYSLRPKRRKAEQSCVKQSRKQFITVKCVSISGSSFLSRSRCAVLSAWSPSPTFPYSCLNNTHSVCVCVWAGCSQRVVSLWSRLKLAAAETCSVYCRSRSDGALSINVSISISISSINFTTSYALNEVWRSYKSYIHRAQEKRTRLMYQLQRTSHVAVT